MRPKRAPAVCLTCVANITPTSPPPPRLTATNDDVPKKCARLRPQTKWINVGWINVGWRIVLLKRPICFSRFIDKREPERVHLSL
jgi:hypothetical protein